MVPVALRRPGVTRAEALAAACGTQLSDAHRVIERYRAAGVDEIVLNPLGSVHLYGETGALDDTRTLLDLLDG